MRFPVGAPRMTRAPTAAVSTGRHDSPSRLRKPGGGEAETDLGGLRGVSGTKIPTAYRAGYERAKALGRDLADPGLVDRYLVHTGVGDPVADAAIASLENLDAESVHRFIEAGMERDREALARAPAPLRAFFERIEAPEWFDPAAALPGCRAFHSWSDLFIPAFFVVTVQNAATLISKAFYRTGRVTTEHGLRRIRQNTRHFIEIMLPGALDRDGEGWKLSVRIRLVHARVRRMLRDSGDWDEADFGAPLSGAHLGLASANFSATMLQQATRLGARLGAEERSGFMQIWRYASHLIGTPDDLLFEGDEARTREFQRVATLLEPSPGEESAVIANALVRALPEVARMTEPREKQAFIANAFRVSRALLGPDLSDRLGFPRSPTWGLLRWLRWKREVHAGLHRMFPRLASRWRGSNFVFLLDAASIPDLSYRLPDRLEARQATPW